MSVKKQEHKVKPGNKIWPVWRFGMVIDLAKCTGCQGCVVSCKTENNVQNQFKIFG
jgi:Fe-S-cluster-containing dehydrogenase component